MNTIFINIGALPGRAKSTVAAEVYSKLKAKNVNCHLLYEKIESFIYNSDASPEVRESKMLRKAMLSQQLVFGKYDVVICDHPVFLMSYHSNSAVVKSNADMFINESKKDLKVFNFVLTDYQDSKSQGLISFLKNKQIKFSEVNYKTDPSEKIIQSLFS